MFNHSCLIFTYSLTFYTNSLLRNLHAVSSDANKPRKNLNIAIYMSRSVESVQVYCVIVQMIYLYS
jgi:hypothetical protein